MGKDVHKADAMAEDHEDELDLAPDADEPGDDIFPHELRAYALPDDGEIVLDEVDKQEVDQ
jgi:hypothetical protein